MVEKELTDKERERLMQVSMLSQRFQEIEEQLQVVEQNLNELRMLGFALDDVEKINGKEIMANLGMNIFVKAKVVDDNVLVSVGNKVLAKKTPKEAKEIINKQIGKIEEIKEQILDEARKFSEAIENIRD